MKLEDFICETLLQVASGIKQAQAQSKEHKMTIVPHHIAFTQGNHVFNDKTGEPVDYLEFNVVVTSAKDPKQDGKESVFVPSAISETESISCEFNPYMSRIKFTVPIHFPKDVGSRY